MADTLGPPLEPYTVIGFWYEDEPVTVGTFAGYQEVLSAGNVGDSNGFQGAWNEIVHASSPVHAEIIAVASMYETLERQDEEDKS